MAVSYGQPCSSSSTAKCRSMSCLAASATASLGSKPARISSSARQCSTRSISVSMTTFASAAVMYLVFGAKRLADLPLRGDLSADLVSCAQRLRLGDPAFEPHGDRAVRPEQDVAVDLHRSLPKLAAAAEVGERVRRALDPQAGLAGDADRLDARLLTDRLLQQPVVPGAVFREQDRAAVDAQDDRRQRVVEHV